MKYASIKENSGGLTISKCCKWLKVSKSGYYEWLKKPETTAYRENLEMKVQLIFRKKNRTYGAIRIRNELRKEGIQASRKHVSKIMKKCGLVAKSTKKFIVTTDSKHNLPISPNLLMRNFVANAPNKVWVSDITYISTEFGWRYLAVVIDLFDRSIVGWALSDNMKKELVIKAMKMAIKRRKPPKGFIAHSDRGSQYCSYAYQGLLSKHGILSSMSRKSDPWDNAVAESFFARFKTEVIYDEIWESELNLASRVREYCDVEWNYDRQHSRLGYLTPHEFRIKWLEKVA